MNKSRCIIILIAITVIVILATVLAEIGLLIPPYIAFHVINIDNYTEGDTDVSTFNPIYCKEVKMIKSEESTASLHLFNTKPPLSLWDILEATTDSTLQPESYFSDWSFLIHPGSEMTVSFCVAKSDPTCVPELRDEVWFRIIRGEKNFNKWRRNQGNPSYAVESFELPISFDTECHTPLTLQYHYEKEGDYYHVIRNSGNCAIAIYVNITINRTQYDDEGKSAGNCKVPNPQSSYNCSIPVTTTHSPYYALLAVDQTSVVTKWKNDIRVTLVCIPRDWVWITSICIAIAGIPVTGVLIVAMYIIWRLIHCYRQHKHDRRNYETIPGRNVPNVSRIPSTKEAPNSESAERRRITDGQYLGTTQVKPQDGLP